MTGGFTTDHLVYLLNGLLWTLMLSALAFAAGRRRRVLRHAGAHLNHALAAAGFDRLCPDHPGHAATDPDVRLYFGLGVIGIEVPPLPRPASA